MNSYFKIGQFAGTFGTQGELVLTHHLGKKTALKDLKAIFIEAGRDSFIPWFITQAKARTETETLVKLEGCDSPEEGRKLIRKDVWLTEEEFRKHSDQSSPLQLIGYELVENGKVLGTVDEIVEQPHQMLCRTFINGKEALIPLHEETLKKIDEKNKKIIVELPAGLLEIYQ